MELLRSNIDSFFDTNVWSFETISFDPSTKTKISGSKTSIYTTLQVEKQGNWNEQFYTYLNYLVSLVGTAP